MQGEAALHNTNKNRFKLIAFFGLFALMAVTRFHHFGSVSTPPDASLAVFFLAGLLLPGWAFLAFLAEAGLIDYLATHYGGVSDWCITPAYGFLIPTYAAMALGGYFSRRYRGLGRSDWLHLGVVALAATTAAFLISNWSFYFFSGYFAKHSILDYFAAITKYFAPYTFTALMYIGAVMGIIAARRFIQPRLSNPR